MKSFHSGKWDVVYTVEDGARLNALRYKKYDLLTNRIEHGANSLKYGLYESRPVYGYDDCFPSVDPSIYPGTEWVVPDHGELCWLAWTINSLPNEVLFEVRSKSLPVNFRRRMIFYDNKLVWKFSVDNDSSHTVYFQHVMHPLMKLSEIREIKLPGFKSVFNETSDCELRLANPEELEQYLLNCPSGKAEMLYANGIEDGRMSWTYKSGLTIESVFPKYSFSTIGIWWNNSGYPDEEGLKRNECAFEPIPGNNSKLYDNFVNGTCLTVGPQETRDWQVEWNVTDPEKIEQDQIQ